eukprot:2821692-Karenia_brevis.AAC.1
MNEDDELEERAGKKPRTRERAQDDLQTNLHGITTNQLEFKKVLGVLWPLPVLKAHKKAYKEEHVQTMLIDDSYVKGVVFDTTHGTPIGTYEINHAHSKGVKKDVLLHSSMDSWDEKESENTWKSLQADMKTKSTGETA